MDEFPEPKTRRKIYDLIEREPGQTLSIIAEKLNMRAPLVENYLRSMERQGDVLSFQEEGDVRRYYIKGRRRGVRGRKTREIRNRLFDLLLEHPGMSLSDIAENLGMSVQLAKYHLLYLKRNNLIIDAKEQGFRRFYVQDSEVGAKDKKIVALLRQEQLLRIVVVILRNPHIKHKQLANHLKVHPSTLTYHIIRLDEYGILDIVTYGREKGYTIRNRKEVILLIRKYVAHTITENFRDMWDEMNIK